jgi:hypothetical protein
MPAIDSGSLVAAGHVVIDASARQRCHAVITGYPFAINRGSRCCFHPDAGFLSK